MNKMDTLKLLAPFFYRHYDRGEWIRKPWTVGDYTHATDGRILVRVPKLDGFDATEDAVTKTAGVIAQFSDWKNAGQGMPLPAFQPRETENCKTCKGTGRAEYVECDTCGGAISLNGQTIKCVDCSGTGHRLKPGPGGFAAVKLGSQFTSSFYYEKLASLPGLVWFNASDALGPMYFRFDDGDGLLMPLKYEEPKP